MMGECIYRVIVYGYLIKKVKHEEKFFKNKEKAIDYFNKSIEPGKKFYEKRKRKRLYEDNYIPTEKIKHIAYYSFGAVEGHYFTAYIEEIMFDD